MLAGEGRVRQGLSEALADDPGCLPEPHPVELLRDREDHGLGGAARLHEMGLGMASLQYASCLDNSNHTEAGRAHPSVWTLFRCQSAQDIVRYRWCSPSPWSCSCPARRLPAR